MVILCETHTKYDPSKRFWEKEGYMIVDVMEVEGHSVGL